MHPQVGRGSIQQPIRIHLLDFLAQCNALIFNNRAKIVACEKVTLTFVDHVEHSASLALSMFENIQPMILKVYAYAAIAVGREI
ncbi:hypothetical protein GALL_432300 [mine drainage metagenome]|uniref:Uncharacterized protein n=1 Tax=mine drainage metagenome TaxID=410659 RepID=A0A1J5PVH4_9ZZZZ